VAHGLPAESTETAGWAPQVTVTTPAHLPIRLSAKELKCLQQGGETANSGGERWREHCRHCLSPTRQVTHLAEVAGNLFHSLRVGYGVSERCQAPDKLTASRHGGLLQGLGLVPA
jgi:hypothetical protein